jgi:hypothetical protein
MRARITTHTKKGHRKSGKRIEWNVVNCAGTKRANIKNTKVGNKDETQKHSKKKKKHER